MSKILAIIPARGGSKRIPRKNIRPFLGTPIISYSIRAAQAAGCFDEIMVSTDDEEIAKISKQEGAAVPFFRSAAMSNDFATLAQVCEEVLEQYHKLGKQFEYICCILPTAPLISGIQLKQAYDIMDSHNIDAVLPVVKFSYPVFRALKIENGRTRMIWPENYNTRSQDLPETYHDAGQFYWLRTDQFLKEKKFFLENTEAFELSEMQVQDIDTETDWNLAELKYKIVFNK